MAGIPGIRDGFSVKVAAKFQTAEGVPVPAVSFVDDDVLRTDSAPAPNPNVEFATNIPTGTGSPFLQDEAVVLVAITPEISATIKATPVHVRFLMEALTSIVPTTSAGPIGTIFKFEGFETGIKRVTWVWDDAIEALQAVDVFINVLEFNSAAGDNLLIDIEGSGQDFNKVDPQLAAVKLTNFDAYSHKESLIDDLVGGTPVEIFASDQTLRLEYELITTRGNAVALNFVTKGRMTTVGSISTKLYDFTAEWMDRVLQATRSDIKYRYVQQDGKLLDMTISNATFLGTYPGVGSDGNLEDFTIDFEARQSGDSDFPFVIEVED